MNYQETLDYLFSQLPMFQRIGAAAYKADLKNTIALCELLDHPENKFLSIHVAGTNGKGSVSSMLAAIMQEAGYKTGLFTSPHLKDFRERIRINGEMIPEERITEFVNLYKEDFKKIQPSFFEWTAALAFDHFATEQVEIAILETGMGGRLDSTNVVVPELSIITNIGWDHMQFLGESLEKIAIEKAGIIKDGVPVIIGEVQEDIAHVFTETAIDRNTSCVFAPLLWEVSEKEVRNAKKNATNKISGSDFLELQVFYKGELKFNELKLDLLGDYQKKNIIPVLQAVSTLKAKGYHIEDENVRSALMKVKTLTGIRGRWEILNSKPFVVADTAHNKNGIQESLQQIKNQKINKLHFVLGLVNDKDLSGILALLPKDAIYYFCKAAIPRALDAKELQSLSSKYDLNGEVFTSVRAAYDSALTNAQTDDMVYIGGSTFVVAEIV